MPPLPAYTADASPPSYDEVAQKLQDLIGGNTDPAKVLDIANTLSTEEINTLADGLDTHYPLQDDKQKADFTVGVGQTLSSEEGQARLKLAGNAASEAVKKIDNIFIQLQLKLAQIDQIYESGFQKTLIGIQDTFKAILRDSRYLAVDIGQHGEQFDKIIIKFCANTDYTVDERRTRIAKFISDAREFENSAKDIQQRYSDLTASFQAFISSFSGWAKDKEGELTTQIKDLEKELEDLNKTLNDIKAAQTALGSVAGVVIPISSILIASQVFPGLNALILVGGLIAAGLALSAVIGLAIAASRLQNEIDEKTAEKRKLEEQLEQIRNAREELQYLGLTSLPEFKSCVQVLSEYWQTTSRDAQLIQTWLEKGADYADQPEYMKMNLEKAVNTYASMSVYLYEYAAGVQSYGY
ncbi:hypothetical protein BDV28DRAFT_133255 [Aspergillus coremiiformis]|uniref:Alpha-xenorhabdolysin family binary toxin subunit A n=1 Tax=Aspergillus coremiiformis TaxID=138285 RepID=A0A5N6Z955_9EURO|nr:hypothetical protein BDV28DRAFT_133255 [Aspergillus coremiiformis]